MIERAFYAKKTIAPEDEIELLKKILFREAETRCKNEDELITLQCPEAPPLGGRFPTEIEGGYYKVISRTFNRDIYTDIPKELVIEAERLTDDHNHEMKFIELRFTLYSAPKPSSYEPQALLEELDSKQKQVKP